MSLLKDTPDLDLIVKPDKFIGISGMHQKFQEI